MKSFIKFIVYSLILTLTINIIYFKIINKSYINQLFGYSLLKVVTGSMEPEISAGDNIIIKKCKEYKIGDIITYVSKDEVLVTHRIVSIDNELYYTKGDSNNVEDPEPITNSQIYGKVIFHFNSFFPNLFFSLSRYVDSNKTSINAKIAKPVFIVAGDAEILIEKSNSINDYNFSIRNYSETSTSEVSLDYTIGIIADDNVKCQLFCNNSLVDTKDIFSLNHGTPEEHKYLLKIEAPKDYEGKIKLDVFAYQRKEEKK